MLIENNLQKDIVSLLKYYVARESDDEKLFNKYKTLCKLKVCLNMYRSDSSANGGKNIHRIHTRLKFSNDIADDDSLEGSNDMNYFYIKSQNVTHRIKANSHNPDENGITTSIETVITRSESRCEVVFKTVVSNTEDGKLQKSQRSFTREVLKYRQPKRDDVDLRRSYSRTSQQESLILPDKQTPKKKSSFSRKKDQKIAKSNGNSSELPKYKIVSKKKSMDSVVLEKIKKPKPKVLEKLKSFLVIKPLINDVTKITPNIASARRSSIFFTKQFSTELNEMEKAKPTNITTEICMDKDDETKKFEIITDDILFMDEENDEDYDYIDFNRQNSVSTNDSYYHFDFIGDTGTRERNDSALEDELCDCNRRRLDVIAKYFLTNRSNIFEEIRDFDYETRHFKNCQFSLNYSPATVTPDENLPPKKRKNSVISVHSETQMFRIIDNLKDNDQINCSLENIKYFMDCTSYNAYEDGLLKVLEPGVTVENLVLFFHLTRAVIKQIDDPRSKDSSEISRIMEFSKTFLLNTFYPEIAKHGDLEKFIDDDLD